MGEHAGVTDVAHKGVSAEQTARRKTDDHAELTARAVSANLGRELSQIHDSAPSMRPLA